MVGRATFSDRWYLVADLHVGLLPTVRIHKQIIRQRVWYILTEPYSQRYFQVSAEAYALLVRLTPNKSIDEIWMRLIEEYPEQAPGQEEVVHMLSQLHHANLLYSSSLPDSGGIVAREQKQRRRELWGKLITFLFIRIPVWDPNEWLGRVRLLAKLCFSVPGILLWLSLVIWAVAEVLPKGAELYQQTQGVLALENLPWLYLCLAALKVLHELGHALVCKHYGGNVHTLGVMFLVFVPLPYMDATSSWSFRQRKQRILVSSAGMLTELFFAAVAALVWSHTGAGLVHSLAFNVMLIGSVSSLLFNGNPLLRFDAYYIFSDIVDIPNLWQKSAQHWRYLAERYLMGSERAVSPAADRRQQLWMVVYGLLSVGYRLFVTMVIVLVVLDQFFAIGVVVSVISIWMWLIRPGWKTVEYLLSPNIRRHRRQAVAVTMMLLLGMVVLVGMVPFPHSLKAPGVVEAAEHHQVIAAVGGFLPGVVVESGESVKAGQLLVELKNPDLSTELVLTRHMLQENKILLRRALWDSPADIAPFEEQNRVLQGRMNELLGRQKNLQIHAPSDGVWVDSALHERVGGWFARGEPLGQVVGTESFRFTAVASQDQADELFRSTHEEIGLYLSGQAERRISIAPTSMMLIPFKRDRLVSAALGWSGGGSIATSMEDVEGKRTVEGFFEVRADLPPVTGEEGNRLLHGQSGELRIKLTAEPIYHQLLRSLQQLLQKRYGLSM